MNPKLCYVQGAVRWLTAPSFAQTFKLALPDKKTAIEITNVNGFNTWFPVTPIHPLSQKTFDHGKK